MPATTSFRSVGAKPCVVTTSCIRTPVPSLSPETPSRVNVVAANRYFDLLDSGVDMAFRTREFEPDSSLTVHRLAATRRVLAASPAYLQGRGPPRHPLDLSGHDLLIYMAYPTRRHLPAKVRSFVDFVLERFQAMDYERKWTE
jgi:DNA-binding transcriptional LysR family regulator